MASLYGGKLVTDLSNSPHLAAAGITGELYFDIEENDAHVLMKMNERLRGHLANVGANDRFKIFTGPNMAFFPKRYCFAPEADTRHRAAIIDLFDSRLTTLTGPYRFPLIDARLDRL